MNFLKKFGKWVLIDLAIVAGFFVVAALFLLFTNFASAESFSTLSDLPGLQAGSQAPTLGAFVNVIFKMAIGLGSVIAVLMIVIGGFQYLSTDMFQTKGAAKERITNALLGLGLLLTSFLILQTINPELVKLDVEIMKAELDSYIELTPENFREIMALHAQRLAALRAEGYDTSSPVRCFSTPAPSANTLVEGVPPGTQRADEGQVNRVVQEAGACRAAQAASVRENPGTQYSECILQQKSSSRRVRIGGTVHGERAAGMQSTTYMTIYSYTHESCYYQRPGTP